MEVRTRTTRIASMPYSTRSSAPGCRASVKRRNSFCMRRAKNKPRQGGHTKWWLGLNLFAIAILLLTYITPWISVNRWGWLSLLALAYPFTLFVNILFVFGWFFFKNRFALLS